MDLHADPSPAFRTLRHALVRRRLRQLDPLLRVELALLAALVMGFVFWQARVPFDGLARAGGTPAVLERLALLLGALLLAGVPAVAGRHQDALARGPAGPEWLALPVPPATLAGHFAWESRVAMALTAPVALALLAAAWGYAPAWTLALAALAFVAAAWGTAVLATAVVTRLRAVRVARRPGIDTLTAVLAAARTGARRSRRPDAHWTREPVWRALWRLDLRVTRAPSAARARAVAPLAFAIASVAVWWVPLEPLALRRALAFALALIAASALADWLLTRVAGDPFAVMRSLPLGVSAAWSARAASVAVFATALAVTQLLAARALAPGARDVFVLWTALAASAIALLGVNYGLTLYPHAERARRMLTLTLGIAMAASFMIPLTGWILLLTAVLHSSRRLARWSRLEEHD
jgi:hypothetical protein